MIMMLFFKCEPCNHGQSYSQENGTVSILYDGHYDYDLWFTYLVMIMIVIMTPFEPCFRV